MFDEDSQEKEAYMHLGFYNFDQSAQGNKFCCRADFEQQTIATIVSAGNCAELGSPWMKQLKISQLTTANRSNISVTFPAGFFAANGIAVPAPDGEVARFQIIFSAFSTDEFVAADTIDVNTTPNVTFREFGGSICKLNGGDQTYRPGIYSAQQVGPDTSQVFNLLVCEVNILNDAGASVSALIPSIVWKTASGLSIQTQRAVSIVRVVVDY